MLLVLLFDVFYAATVDKSEGTERGDSFTKRWLTKVVDNLQLFVDKVHIRYEDDRTNPEVWLPQREKEKHPFFLGPS